MLLDQSRQDPDDATVQPAASPPSLRIFLIADVRGYTRFTQEHGNAAAARLAMRFADLVQEELTGIEAQLLGLRGDEAAIAFGCADDALRVALALQERFAHAMAADPTLPLRVGMGLDAGEAVPVADGYRGMAINVAARLCSLAGPGQVLVTAGLADRASGHAVAYVERGTASLKGITEAMRVLQALPHDYTVLVAAPADAEAAERVRRDLAAAGVACWTERPLPGSEADISLRAALRSPHASGSVVVLISPHVRSSRAVAAALRLVAFYERAVIPLWIAGTEAATVLPTAIQSDAVLDAREGRYAGAVAAVVERLQRQRTKARMGSRDHGAGVESGDGEAPRNPYKGLRAFGEEDSGDFFGRDAVVTDLVAALESVLAAGQARLLAVTGPSGSGKSSLLRAGLLPRLKAGALPGSASWRYLGPLVPGSQPLAALVAHDGHGHQADVDAATVRTSLDGDSTLALHRRAQQLVTSLDERVLLVIDQGEEVFTQAGAGDRQRLFDLLTAAVSEPGGPLVVLLAVRADYYHRFLDDPLLWHLLEPRTRYIPPLTAEDLREAIVGPARLPDVGLHFEQGLVGDLLAAVEGQAGTLPLLQFTLDELYERREGSLLTAAAYRSIGGVRGALAWRAERTYAILPDAEHRELARALFLRLITPGVSDQETTRRRARLTELDLSDPDRAGRMRAVVAAFVAARLLTVDEVEGVPTIEVSHEALIGEWGQLEAWLREAREDVRLQARLSADAAEWDRRERPADALYRGRVLAEALGWVERNTASALEAAFLTAAEDEAGRQALVERERQAHELVLTRRAATRLRVLAGVLGVFLLVAAGLSTLALRNARQAQTSAQAAIAARNIALSRQLADN